MKGGILTLLFWILVIPYINCCMKSFTRNARANRGELDTFLCNGCCNLPWEKSPIIASQDQHVDFANSFACPCLILALFFCLTGPKRFGRSTSSSIDQCKNKPDGTTCKRCNFQSYQVVIYILELILKILLSLIDHHHHPS